MENRSTILITGAASGIGRATAILFAKNGWYIGLYDVNAKDLGTLAREIGHENCCHKAMDVTNIVSVRKGVEHFSRNTGGRMDVLFNNAGVVWMGAFDEIGPEKQSLVIDVNLKGVINCTHAALRLLKDTKSSRVIIMSSASSIYGTPYITVYSATKAAVSSLAESLNLELGRQGIFVCDVRAPYVRTPLLEQKIQAPSIGKLGIHLVPEDVANTVWKAAHGCRLHNDTKGMKPLLFLMLLPNFMRKILFKYLLLPDKNGKE